MYNISLMPVYHFRELVIHVSNLSRSIDFYSSILGFSLDDQEEFMGHQMAHMSNGNVRIFLLQEPPAWPPQWHHLGAMLHFVVGNDIEELHKSLMDKGAHIFRELSLGSWGDRIFIITDPDGYRIMFSERGE